MDDLISRQAAIDAMNTRLEDIKLTWRGKVKKGEIAMYLDMRGVIETLPSAQPEWKKGSWNVIQGNIVVCSECGMLAPKSMTGCLLNRHLEPNRTNFCPSCGADMRKREGDNV